MRSYVAFFCLSLFLISAAGFHPVHKKHYRIQRSPSPSSILQPTPFGGGRNSHWRQPSHRNGPTSANLMLLLSDGTDTSTSLDFLQNRDVWVFIAGIFPFAWATVEFWRRIAVGEPFGTGQDQVIIGMDDAPADSRGRRVLGKDALITAYILFALAFGTIGVVLYSVISSGAPPEVLPSSETATLLLEQ